MTNDAPSAAGAATSAEASPPATEPESKPKAAAAPAPSAPAPAPAAAAAAAGATAAPATAPATPPAPAAAALPLLPHPNEIPDGDPDDPADPPGLVPPGDSRSLRRGNEFVLVYRLANIVISRFGALGRRGQFRVVEYPTMTYAANAYARECSRWVVEGYSDYREP